MSQQHTQCPSCGAVYPMPSAKIGNPTAKAKCGRCQQVFLLNDNLVQSKPPISQAHQTPNAHTNVAQNTSIDQIPPSAPNTSKLAQSVQVQEEQTVDDFSRFLDEQMQIATSSIHGEKSPDGTTNEAWIQDALDNSNPNDVAINQSTNTHANPKADIDLSTIIAPASNLGQKRMPSFKKAMSHRPTTQQLATKKSFVSQLMWLIGSIILMGLMVMQYTLFNLESIIASPSHADKVHAFCSLAKCSAPHADLGSIAISATHKNSSNKTDVIITFFNRSSQEQLYPDLLVRLKDSKGVVVADFVAKRSDYLAESQKSILGNQTKRIQLTVKLKQTPTVVEVTPLYQSP
ncbi:DUF3426 domain-containing protein [Moraxella sp. VT-16-12]|uniref:DUF3426 domain-containing protein n=1 Tax=Moraxella sp. VT-16-12 TaxID=2014877 RepID=UPI000B7C5DBE|nr:DUF3426 domain-containing protein [Moraxella sp. VT-16-12]TWV80660.1 DUF3426 domain-containing protein [Moraxella sp. VT-16-12]